MITPAQRLLRNKSIGSSDMSAILGINRFKTAYDVWLEKTGKLLEQDSDLSDAADAGNRFERSVLSWASEHLGKLRRNVYLVAPNNLPIHAYTDAMVIASKEPVEAKTGGLFGPLWGNWGEPGSGDVPEPYIIQAHIEMICAEKELCHMPVFLGGRGFQMYRVDLNKDLRDIIIERAVTFWNEHVLADSPPEDIAPTLSLMSRVKRTPGKRVRVSSESIVAWRKAAEAKAEAEKAEKEAKAKMLAELGDGDVSDPVEIEGTMQEVSFLEQAKETIDSKMLREKYPEIAKECVKETKYRVARIRKSTEEQGDGK